MIRLVIPGHARPSARITERGKWSRAAQGYLAWQRYVAETAIAAIPGPKPLPWTQFRLRITFYFCNRKRGDLTNLVKAIEDGLQYGRIIKNDNAVVDCHGRICSVPGAADERVEIELEEA